MGMIIDVIFAIAEVAVASGAITEFQFRVAFIRSAADGTAVGIGCIRFCLLRRKRNGSCGLFRSFSRTALSLDFPRHWDQVACIFAKEQEIVRQSYQGEQALGVTADTGGHSNNFVDQIDEIKQRH